MRTTAVCFGVLSLLAVGCRPAAAPSAALEMGEVWLASYLGDQKIGHSVSRYDRYNDGYRFDNLMNMQVAMAGKSQEVRSRSTVNTWPDLTLQSLSFTFESQDRRLSATGRVLGKELLIETEQGSPRAIQLAGPVYPMAAIGRLVVSRPPDPDSTLRFDVFDATMMAVVPVEVKLLGRDTVMVQGVGQEALKAEVRIGRLIVTSWFDNQGMILVEESPPQMRSERTTPEKAMAGETGRARLDMLRMFRVQVDTLVPEPAKVRYCRLAVSGVGAREFDFGAENQEVVSTEPLVVSVSVPELPGSAVGLPVRGASRLLEPSVAIQSDDPRIRQAARDVIGDVQDGAAAARKLVYWVFTAVAKEPTASFPTALDVLEHMEGDCNEHAVFFAALARAAGIPTKVVVGLVYMDGAFYYHAWNEVFLDKWIPVDATFGEFPASGLHLKLSEGELREQAQILAVVGRIEIRILEFS